MEPDSTRRLVDGSSCRLSSCSGSSRLQTDLAGIIFNADAQRQTRDESNKIISTHLTASSLRESFIFKSNSAQASIFAPTRCRYVLLSALLVVVKQPSWKSRPTRKLICCCCRCSPASCRQEELTRINCSAAHRSCSLHWSQQIARLAKWQTRCLSTN